MGGVAVIFGRVGLLYVARVAVRDDFAIGRRSRYDGRFYPWRGVYTGSCIENGYTDVVYDYTRPAKSMGWKVGFTTNIRVRANALVAECGAMEFVALTACGRRAESNAHCHLASMGAPLLPCGPRGLHGYGHSREWYRESPQFDSWLASSKASWRGSIHYRSNSGVPVPIELLQAEVDLLAEASR